MRQNWKLFVTSLFLFISGLFLFLALQKPATNRKYESPTFRVGVSLYRGDDEFISSVSHSLEEVARKKEKEYQTKFELRILDAKNNQVLQNAQVDELIRNQYDVIAINIVDRTVAANLISKAKQANIPIIFFNREPVKTDLQQWEKAFYVGSSAQESGTLEGQLVATTYQRFPKRLDLNQDGVLQYVMLEGEETHQDSLIRTETSITAIREAGIKVERLARGVGNWMRQPSYDLMTQWLQEYPDQIEVVISNNDEMALGAMEAIEAKNLASPPQIVGIDGTKDSLEAIRAKKMLGTVLTNTTSHAEAILTLGYGVVYEKNLEELLPKLKDQAIWVSHQSYLRQLNQ